MESLFHNRCPNVTVNLRNNHDTYLAASDDEKSLTLVSPTKVGSIPKNAEWTIKFLPTTSPFTEFTEFSLWSIYDKELAAQKGENGEIVVCQKIPNSSRPFYWRLDNSQPPSGGLYLFCDCEIRWWISDVYKLSATQDGTIFAKPSFDDTMLDPGSWWFIEVVQKSTPESGSVSKQQAPETGSTSSVFHRPPVLHHQFTDKKPLHGIISPCEDQSAISTCYGWSAPGSSYKFLAGMNTNGAGNQNIGDVKIKNKFSVTKAGHAMTPYYNHEGPYFGNGPPEMQDEQPPYNPEHQPGSFIPSNLGSSTPYSRHGTLSPNLGNDTHHTTSMSPFSEAPGISTYINTGNNSNGSGTQTNNVSIKNKGPIYKYW